MIREPLAYIMYSNDGLSRKHQAQNSFCLGCQVPWVR